MVGRLITQPALSFPAHYGNLYLMRTTRSSSSINAATSKMSDSPTLTATPSTLGKRKADTKLTKNAKKLAKQEAPPNTDPEQHQSASNAMLVPAVLTFDFQEAKRHLIQADHRFEDLFQRMSCKPFEHLEQLDPFRYGFWCPSYYALNISCNDIVHLSLPFCKKLSSFDSFF